MLACRGERIKHTEHPVCMPRPQIRSQRAAGVYAPVAANSGGNVSVSEQTLFQKQRQRTGAAVAAAGVALFALCALAPAHAATPYTGIMPRADCGPGDRIETGLQGQTTVAERQSGDSKTAYNCNLQLVGQAPGEGAEYQMTWSDNCAYYATAN